MKKIYVIHGFNSSPDRNWFPWLRGKLEQCGMENSVLSMPTPRYPIEKEWIDTIKKIIENPNKDTFLIGHSLGASSILRYLETLSDNEIIGGAILVSGAIKFVPGPEGRYDLLNKFLDHPFNFTNIKKVCKKFIVIHGVDDPVVSFSHAEELSKNLGCELIAIENGKHLNDKSDFTEFPQVLDSILKIVR